MAKQDEASGFTEEEPNFTPATPHKKIQAFLFAR